MPSHILGLIDDLFFSPRLTSTGASLGYLVTLIESSETLDADDFLARLESHPPHLIVLDLNSRQPWQPWLAAAKADSRFASIPWLAFGSHKDTELLARAKQAGADRVVAKSRFTSEMPALISGLIETTKKRR